MFKIICLMLDYRIIVNIRSVMYMYKVIDTIRFLCMNWWVIVVAESQQITTTLRGFSAKIILLSRDVGVTSHVKSRWYSTQKAKCPPWLSKLGKNHGSRSVIKYHFLYTAKLWHNKLPPLLVHATKCSIFRNGNSKSWRMWMVTKWHNYENK